MKYEVSAMNWGHFLVNVKSEVSAVSWGHYGEWECAVLVGDTLR